MFSLKVIFKAQKKFRNNNFNIAGKCIYAFFAVLLNLDLKTKNDQNKCQYI